MNRTYLLLAAAAVALAGGLWFVLSEPPAPPRSTTTLERIPHLKTAEEARLLKVKVGAPGQVAQPVQRIDPAVVEPPAKATPAPEQEVAPR
jgi:hypothetical protein